MNSLELRDRTKRFALSIVGLSRLLPRSMEAQVMNRQLFRSATSVAANYRAATRARSKPEFFAKISIVVEEIDESVFWLELIKESGTCTRSEVDTLLKEATELLYIFSATRKTAKDNMTSQHAIKK